MHYILRPKRVQRNQTFKWARYKTHKIRLFNYTHGDIENWTSLYKYLSNCIVKIPN